MQITDGNWTLVEHDHKTGRSTWHWFDGVRNHWRTDYPVDSILKNNAAERNDHINAGWQEGRRVASIPLNVYYEQLDEASQQGDDRYLSRWLNDSDNAAWRTFGGQV